MLLHSSGYNVYFILHVPYLKHILTHNNLHKYIKFTNIY